MNLTLVLDILKTIGILVIAAAEVYGVWTVIHELRKLKKPPVEHEDDPLFDAMEEFIK